MKFQKLSIASWFTEFDFPGCNYWISCGRKWLRWHLMNWWILLLRLLHCYKYLVDGWIDWMDWLTDWLTRHFRDMHCIDWGFHSQYSELWCDIHWIHWFIEGWLGWRVELIDCHMRPEKLCNWLMYWYIGTLLPFAGNRFSCNSLSIHLIKPQRLIIFVISRNQSRLDWHCLQIIHTLRDIPYILMINVQYNDQLVKKYVQFAVTFIRFEYFHANLFHTTRTSLIGENSTKNYTKTIATTYPTYIFSNAIEFSQI